MTTIHSLLGIIGKSIAAGALLWGVSCTKNYSDLNRSPDQATVGDLNKDALNVGGLITNMERNILPAQSDNSYQRGQNLTGDLFSGYMSPINNWNGSSNNSTYNLYFADWNLVGFRDAYGFIMTPWLQIKRAAPSPDIFAVAEIIKIACMHRITDNYGPIPYSAFGAGSLQVPYDSQESVYMAFFKELTEAVSALEAFIDRSSGVRPLQAYDLLFDGDYTKWIKYANSLKLRLAMRIVYADPAKAKQFAEEAVNNKYGVMTDNADNAILRSGKGVVIYNYLKVIWDNYSDARMGASMESFLVGYNDKRLPVYFRPVEVKPAGTPDNEDIFIGVRSGIVISTKQIYEKTTSVPNFEANSPVQIMVAAESYFLRAEGAIRGFNMGGTAQELYERGVQMSFSQHNIPDADFQAYINDDTSTPIDYQAIGDSPSISALTRITIRWDEGANFETKLERTITQKWLAMYPEGQEAWSEFRRTRYPRIFPVAVNNSAGTINTNLQVRRIPFTQGEYSTNNAEVQKAIGLLGGPDNGGTRVWWDKKN